MNKSAFAEHKEACGDCWLAIRSGELSKLCVDGERLWNEKYRLEPQHAMAFGEQPEAM